MKNKTTVYLLAVLLLITGNIHAITNDTHGFFSSRPAKTWEEYLVSGNGTMGLMVAGSPYSEEMVFNHTNLFMPIHRPLIPPSQANHMEEMRGMMANGNYQAAADLLVDISHADGFGKKRQSDLFVPAFQLCLKAKQQAYRDYKRTVNFMTGEIVVTWTDKNGTFERRSFVSRPDNVVVTEIRALKGKLIFSLNVSTINRFDPKRKIKFSLNDSLNIASFKQQVSDNSIAVCAAYAKPWKGGYKGYAGLLRFAAEGGKVKAEDEELTFVGVKRVLMLAEIAPQKELATSPEVLFGSHLDSLKGCDYDALLAKNRKVQADLMGRVCLKLAADTTAQNMSSEDLLKCGGHDKRLIEKLFDAARYNIISATGINPPNLQGIWGATMTPPWAGDYTTNGNLPTAVSHYLPSSTPELMLPLFDKLESQMDDYRTNARVLFGCKGIHVPSHICLHGYDNQFDATWPMTFWTAGAAWYSLFYYDYYLHTLDESFLFKRALPFMLEAVDFYEDFLVADNSGTLMFTPSYSPENHPSNNKSQACVNATMDIAVCKALLRDLIAVSEHFNINADRVNKWKDMLHHMPAYELNADGELREWTWRDLQDNHEHRHASHLIGLYYRRDPEIMASDSLRNGALQAIRKRLDYRKKTSGVMAFGLSQLAFSACALGDATLPMDMLAMAADNYFNNNLMTTHDPHSIFNTDMSGAYPTIVMDMLAYSNVGEIDLLPACPEEWTEGELTGMGLRGGIRMDSLKWNGNSCTITLTSRVDQTVKVSLRGRFKTEVSLKANLPYTFNL